MLLFDTHPLSQKVKDPTNDSRAVIHLESSEEVEILEGSVEVDEDVDPASLARFKESFERKYDRPAFGGFAFSPRIAYAWLNSDFRTSVTRCEFE